MSVSLTKRLAEAERDKSLDKFVTITLVGNLKKGDEFDLREVPVKPEGYKLVVRAIEHQPNSDMVRVFFEEAPGFGLPKPALMNGTFPAQVIRRPVS